MASHLEVGKEGEKLAEAFLAAKGYTMLHRNWRYGKYEIDLIATKNDMLRFIEVKYRTGNPVGHPEDAVTRKKLKAVLQAIEQYLYLHPQYNDFRLDIIAITRQSEEEIAYFLIEDVYL